MKSPEELQYHLYFEAHKYSEQKSTQLAKVKDKWVEMFRVEQNTTSSRVHAVGATTEDYIRELSNQVGQIQQQMSKWQNDQGSRDKSQQGSKNNPGWQHKIGNYHGEVMDGYYRPNSTQIDGGYQPKSVQRTSLQANKPWNSCGLSSMMLMIFSH